jgi:hypothetical protein
MEEFKLNLDGVHMDMQELLDKYECKMHSCSDGREIQQISLFCQQNRNDYRKPVLMDMINPMFAYAALYPHTQKLHKTYPEGTCETAEEIVKELIKKRDDRRK